MRSLTYFVLLRGALFGSSSLLAQCAATFHPSFICCDGGCGNSCTIFIPDEGMYGVSYRINSGLFCPGGANARTYYGTGGSCQWVELRIRQVRPELPDSVTVNMVIPSDEKLYVLVGEVSDGKILEIDTGTGDVLAQFFSSNVVACVHNKQFLSFDYSSGGLVPLVGTPQPLHVEQSKKE